MPSSLNSFFRQNTPRRLSNVGQEQQKKKDAEAEQQSLKSISSSSEGRSRSTETADSKRSLAPSPSLLLSEQPAKSPVTQRTLPAISTATIQERDVPTKSNSVPSIELFSPSGSTKKHIWDPDEQNDSDRSKTPSPKSGPPVVAQSPGELLQNPFEGVSPRQISDAILVPDPRSRQVNDRGGEEDEEDDPLFSVTPKISSPVKMVRPSSSHSKGRSEGAPGSAKKASKADVPDRHDIMRRAMADAVASDTYGTSSDGHAVDARPGSSNGLGLSSAPFPSTNGVQQASTQSAVGLPSMPSSGTIVDHEKPGNGSLTFDHFDSTAGEGEVVLPDGSGIVPAESAAASMAKTISQEKKISLPRIPLRPKLGSRNNSFQSDVDVMNDKGNVHDSPTQNQMPVSADTHNVLHQLPVKQKVPGHGRYATTGHAVEPVRTKQTSLAVPAGNGVLDVRSNTLPDTPSSSSLLPLPLGKLRRLSDAGSKKSASPSGGIAGALAASGMAGMGVGHAELLQRSQAQLEEQKAAAAAASAAAASTNKKNRSRAPSIVSTNNEYASGYEGGVYLDPETGKMIERGPDHEIARQRHLPPRSRTQSSANLSNLSYDGSDISAGSGLHAAANFALGLQNHHLAPEDPLLQADGASAPMTPGGIGAVGGLSPSGLGERVTLDDEGWHTNDMGVQITGFAVASSKRNAEFHALFPSVSEDDYLIEDYGCALVREILIQGRLYVSENHVCFYANIFGWVTNIVMPFSEIMSVEKRMTAYVIPNAIQVATLHTKYTFASFLSRDTTYDLIINIWKLSHPSLQPSDTYDLIGTDDESVEGGDGATVIHADQDDKRKLPQTPSTAATTGDGAAPPPPAKKSKRKLLKKKLGIKDAATLQADSGKDNPVVNAGTISRGKSPALGAGAVRREPHRKTTCSCEKEKKHATNVALDTTYPTVPEKLYNLIFTSGFMKDFWQDNQKLMELQLSDWSPNAQNANMLSRDISYIKPLSGGFGPKQTKCVLTDENMHVDFDEYVTMMTTTRTPDVPSGGSFSVKTRTCITWDGTGNVSRMLVTFQVEWTARSMLKSVIDRASGDGQRQYYADLDKAIRGYIKEHASEFREEGEDPEAAVAAITEHAEHGGAGEKGADGTGADGTSGGANADGEKSGLNKVIDALQPVIDIGSGLFESLSELSPTVLILGAVVFFLVMSNLWAWSSSHGVSRDPLDPHRLQPQQQRRPMSSSAHYKGSKSDHASAAASADAVALAVRDVLRDYFEPHGRAVNNANTPTPSLTSPSSLIEDGEVNDPSYEIEALLGLLDDVESRVSKLRAHLEQQRRLLGPTTNMT